ncbi:NAD-dependent epimerase/dehydratase family protein [Candidatus Microgenomates bacterium]|nr:NAD-dependent epimerase/dehydratase family protein [Candidatus Microgenomates bacterium]
MAKLNFVVTGGAGFIGSWVIDYILKSYKNQVGKITVLDNFTRGTRENLQEALKSKKVKIITGDIRDPKTVDRAVRGADYVIHEAVIRITQCAEDPRLCNEILVDGTFNVLEACAKHKVKKLVFNSSASVYGNPSYVPMDENHPYNNETLYGAAKIANEQMARAFRAMYGLNYVCLRPFNAYGARMDIFGVYTEVLIRWLDRIDQGLSPVIFGDGKQSLDFIYVEDIAYATICALKSKINEGFYNVGSGRETSLNTLAKKVLQLTKSPLAIVHEAPRKFTNVERRKADTRRAKKDLGFKAQISLSEGLRRLIKWRKEAKSQKAAAQR